LLDWSNRNNTAALVKKCQYGSVSPLYVEVKNPKDVQLAFNFTKLTKVPLAIRNTGHDYLGRSSAPKSLGVSVSTLKKASSIPGHYRYCTRLKVFPAPQMEFAESFVPEGCDASAGKRAITTGAGVTWAEVYEFADQYNSTIVGGGDGSVGATGGLLQGGGHSPISNTLGMVADRAVCSPLGISAAWRFALKRVFTSLF
jgi:FAD/FMN-containing dehydrogenase